LEEVQNLLKHLKELACGTHTPNKTKKRKADGAYSRQRNRSKSGIRDSEYEVAISPNLVSSEEMDSYSEEDAQVMEAEKPLLSTEAETLPSESTLVVTSPEVFPTFYQNSEDTSELGDINPQSYIHLSGDSIVSSQREMSTIEGADNTERTQLASHNEGNLV